jgi:hypothetical protein
VYTDAPGMSLQIAPRVGCEESVFPLEKQLP